MASHDFALLRGHAGGLRTFMRSPSKHIEVSRLIAEFVCFLSVDDVIVTRQYGGYHMKRLRHTCNVDKKLPVNTINFSDKKYFSR